MLKKVEKIINVIVRNRKRYNDIDIVYLQHIGRHPIRLSEFEKYNTNIKRP